MNKGAVFHVGHSLAGFFRGDYARGFFRRLAVQIFALVVLVEAIFLAEHFTWVFRDAVRHDADLFSITLVLLCTSTEIFDLALAIAVLVAAYAIFLRMRENRELLVLFAGGLGPYQLSALVLAACLAAQLVGLVGSGIVDPVSRYAQRSLLFSTELQSLKKGAARGEFYYFPNYVAYAMDHPVDPAATGVIDARGGQGGSNRTLFVYQQIAAHAARIVTAASAKLDGPDRDGKIVLSLNDFTSHTFADAHPLAGPALAGSAASQRGGNMVFDGLEDIPQVTMNVRDMSQMMLVNQLLPFGARGSDVAEQTIFEQLAPGDDVVFRAAQMRLLSERFSRSLLSFLAPLLALLAVALTSARTNWFALPLASLLLMSVYLGCEGLITALAPMGVGGALLPPLLLFAALCGGVILAIVRLQRSLVRPGLARQ